MQTGNIIAVVAAVVLGFLWWSRHQANQKKRKR
jgi:UDP-N-acetylmuramyl pentapeptide phosphotransferase/UDP-N-acetylglucosamine-1-phosphate transferase